MPMHLDVFDFDSIYYAKMKDAYNLKGTQGQVT